MKTLTIKYRTHEMLNHDESQITLAKREPINLFKDLIYSLMETKYGKFSRTSPHTRVSEKNPCNYTIDNKFENEFVSVIATEQASRKTDRLFPCGKDNTEEVNYLVTMKITQIKQANHDINSDYILSKLRNTMQNQLQRDPDAKIKYGFGIFKSYVQPKKE